MDLGIGRRVMVLEDEAMTLELEEEILINEGYYVIPINGYKPLEYLVDFVPDVILLDVRLGGGYGHLLCEDLKANPVTSMIPTILVSGASNLEGIAETCNADGYLSKPFSAEELLDVVKRFNPEPMAS